MSHSEFVDTHLNQSPLLCSSRVKKNFSVLMFFLVAWGGGGASEYFAEKREFDYNAINDFLLSKFMLYVLSRVFYHKIF